MDTHINQAHVVEPSETPALEPLKGWSDDLVGKRVVCLRDGFRDYIKAGFEYTIEKFSHWGDLSYDPHNDPHIHLKGISPRPSLNLFALSPDQPGQEEGEMKRPSLEEIKEQLRESYRKAGIPEGHPSINLYADLFNEQHKMMDKISADMFIKPVTQDYMDRIAGIPTTPTQPITEITHSCTLEFPNGDIVEIPGPEGEGWTWQGVDCSESWPKQHWDNRPTQRPSHTGGQMVWDEYTRRANKENPIVLKYFSWERTYTPTVEVDTVHEALSAFPLLNGVK